MLESLARHGCHRIEAQGAAFDPALHEAIMMQPSSEPPGTVLHVADGWEGTWHVTETVRKSYVIVRTPAPAGAEDLR